MEYPLCLLDMEKELKWAGLMYCKKSNNEHLMYYDNKGRWWVMCNGRFPCLYNEEVHFKVD